MAVRELRLWGDDVLRQRAADVVAVDEDVRQLIDDMFETMYQSEGVGLAGPQIGVSRRVIVVDVREEGVKPFALVNPRLVETSSDVAKEEEGCLSMPGITAAVERPARVVVEGLNRDGEPVRIEGDALLARCLQHEIDHLDGILFVDRLSALQRSMLARKWKKRR